MGHARALLGTPDRAFQEQLAKPRGQRRPLGPGGRGSDPSPRRPRAADANRGATPRAEAPAAGSARARGAARRPPRHAGEDHDGPASRARSLVEFSTLEDLERIYRAMTDGGRPPELARRSGRDRRSGASTPRRTPSTIASASLGHQCASARSRRRDRRARTARTRPRPSASRAAAGTCGRPERRTWRQHAARACAVDATRSRSRPRPEATGGEVAQRHAGTVAGTDREEEVGAERLASVGE